MQLYYYANSRGTSAVDFVVRTDSEFIPLEVNLQLNLRSKTLKTYREKFSPGVSVRVSMADFKAENGLINLPLYAVEAFPSVVSNVLS